MDADFWHERWEENRLGFHEEEVNRGLVKHLGALGLAPNSRIFVPLCGKTVDIGWLRKAGAPGRRRRLSPIAIGQLFDGLGIEPQITSAGPFQLYSAPGIEIYVGDIFDLDQATLGPSMQSTTARP